VSSAIDNAIKTAREFTRDGKHGIHIVVLPDKVHVGISTRREGFMCCSEDGGEGGVGLRKDGRWYASVSAGYAMNGRRVREYVYGSTKAEVLEKRVVRVGEVLNHVVPLANLKHSRPRMTDVLAYVPDAEGCGFVYFIHGPSDTVKIGWSHDPQARIRDLQCATPVDLYFFCILHGGRRLERILHAAFGPWRVRGEWFGPSAVIRQALADRKLDRLRVVVKP
jgi:hypothetical protein